MKLLLSEAARDLIGRLLAEDSELAAFTLAEGFDIGTQLPAAHVSPSNGRPIWDVSLGTYTKKQLTDFDKEAIQLVDGIPFLIPQGVLAQVNGLTLDFRDCRFILSSTKP